MLALVALVLPLGLDTFAVAAALGASRPARAVRLRLGLTCAAFEALMPLAGLLAGSALVRALGAWAEWIGLAALLALGLWMALSRESGAEGPGVGRMAAAGPGALLLLGLSVSLDELAIGFGFGLLHVPPAPALALIGLQAFGMSQLGLALGARVPEGAREGAERLAGVALALMALGLAGLRLAGHPV